MHALTCRLIIRVFLTLLLAFDKAEYLVGQTYAQVTFAGALHTIGTKFGSPSGVAVDATGNVFATDCDDKSVKEIMASDGSIRSFRLPSFTCPTSIVLDKSANIFVANRQNSPIFELRAPDYTSISSFGSGFNPMGLAVDKSSDLYIADTGCSCVYELVASGGVITANSRTRIWKDPAYFHSTTGVAVDSFGNVFVADPTDRTVRIMQAVGGLLPDKPNVYSVGSNLVAPYGIAIDSKDNLYLSETQLSANDPTATVKRLPPDNNYRTPYVVAASYLDNAFGNLNGVAVDSQGQVYVADTYGRVSRLDQQPVDFGKLALDGSTKTQYSLLFNLVPSADSMGPIDIQTSTGFINSPTKESTDFFNLAPGTCRSFKLSYAPTNACTVDVVFKPSQFGSRTATLQVLDTKASKVLATAQLQGTGIIVQSTIGTGFDHPQGFAIDNVGALEVADTFNRRIVPVLGTASIAPLANVAGNFAIDAAGNFIYGDMLTNSVSSLSPTGIVTILAKGLLAPHAVAIDKSGNLYVADSGHGIVEQIPKTSSGYGAPQVILKSTVGASPFGVAVNPINGNVFVSDSTSGSIFIIEAKGGNVFDSPYPISAPKFNFPAGIAIDTNGNLFVANAMDDSVELVPQGSYGYRTVLADSKSGELKHPLGIAVDANDIVYVADTGNSRVLRLTISTAGPLH